MNIYADPDRCPGCRSSIEHAARSCTHCGLPLTGDTVGELFRTLTRADELVGILRAAMPAPAPALHDDVAGSAPAPGVVPVARKRRTGLSAASVPKILLGLGALCLLVAGLVFLAVAWSVMGVAGRTATLLGFTAVAAALTWWQARRDLRTAAEALALVSLGLLSLDVVGADNAGWFGNLSGNGLLALLGGVLAAAGTAAVLGLRATTPVGLLVAPQVVAVVGVLLLGLGALEDERLAVSAGLVGFTLLGALAAAAAYRLGLVPGALGCAAIAVVGWAGLTLTSLERALRNPTGHALWVGLEVWPLLAAAVLAAALVAVRRLPVPVRFGGLAVAQVILGYAAVVPFTQGSVTESTLAALVLLAVGSVIVWFLRQPLAWGAMAVVTLAAVWSAVVAAELFTAAGTRVLERASVVWSGSVTGRMPAAVDASAEPWLLPVLVTALGVACFVLAHRSPRVDRVVAPMANLGLVGAVGVVAVVGTLASYPVPLWSVLACLLPATVGFAVWAVTTRDLVAATAAACFAGGAVVASLSAELLTASALVVVLAAGHLVHRRWDGVDGIRTLAGAVSAAALAGAVWSGGAVADADPTWTAVVALLALGAAVLVPQALRSGSLDRLGFEAVAVAAGILVAGGGLDAAADQSVWLAVYLTLGGAVLAALALVRPDRRRIGWAGGVLLAAATWVRLWDIGVTTPEAYTVPAALALLTVGVVHLRRNPLRDTAAALSPGLALALLPSLLLVLADPLALRSVLLGLACLIVLAAGLRLRWSAPVAFAATVAAVLVLRHSAPLAEAVPRWALIGAAGALLVGMGITWESRLREARGVLGYVRSLR